jgi:hypothetical protein
MFDDLLGILRENKKAAIRRGSHLALAATTDGQISDAAPRYERYNPSLYVLLLRVRHQRRFSGRQV